LSQGRLHFLDMAGSQAPPATRSQLSPMAPVFLHTSPVYTTAWPILNSNRSFHTYCPLYAPLSLLPTWLLRRTSRRFPAFLCRLRLLHHPDEPPSTLGCGWMGGDSPCFSRGHCSEL